MEVRSVRLDEIRLIKEDVPAPWIRYVGRSDSFVASDSDALWQIMRVVKEGSVTTTTYANKGSFTAKWSDRASYFPAVTVSYAAYEQAMDSSFDSDTIVVTSGRLSIQACWSGNNAADGTLTLYQSTDGVDWCEYPDSTKAVSLTPDCAAWDIQKTGAPFFRVSYVAGSNSAGSLDIAYNTSAEGRLWLAR